MGCGTGRASLRYKRHKRAEKAHTIVEIIVIPDEHLASCLSSQKRSDSSHQRISGRDNAVFVAGRFVFFPLYLIISLS